MSLGRGQSESRFDAMASSHGSTEMLDHTANGLWEVVPRHIVPQGKLLSCGVWTEEMQNQN